MQNKVLMTKRQLMAVISENVGTNYRESEQILLYLINEQETLSFSDIGKGVGLGDVLFDKIGGSALQGIKQTVIEIVLSNLGILPEQWLGKTIANIISEISVTDLYSLITNFDEDGCTILLETILSGVSEALVELGIDAMFNKMKSEISVSVDRSTFDDVMGDTFNFDLFIGAKKLITSTIREKVFEMIIPKEKRREVIRDICENMPSMSEIGGSFLDFGGDEQDAQPEVRI